MKATSLLLILFLFSGSLVAQNAHFITSGSIEFEKTVNMYALIKRGQILGKNIAGNELQLFEQYRQSHPQFSTLKSTLTFRDSKTLYTPTDREVVTGQGFSVPLSAQNNTVYTDHVTNTRIAAKNVLGEAFLLTDSARKINWKLTSETREVAGYTCRRANALILDSIYVVAFFTEKIHVPGGPESFGGLPGMILELAIPHENVSWRATKVTTEIVPVSSVSAPKNGKVIDGVKLIKLLDEASKGWKVRQAEMMVKVNLL